MKKFSLVSLVLAAGALLSSCQNQLLTPEKTQPSYVAVEMHSGRVLYSQNANVRRPIGMLTNLATAAVVLDWVKSRNISKDRMLRVPASAVQWQRTNLLKLQPGDTISLRDALCTAVMVSDSACAATLAHACGSELNPSSPESAFVNQMNLMAKRLGMNSTYFKGSNGAVITQSSARDMALLGMYVAGYSDGEMLALTSQPQVTVTVHSAAGARAHTLTNTNRLLSSGVDGLKAATSRTAGSCLLATAHRASVKRPNPATGQPGTYAQRLIVVMLGMPSSDSRYSTAAKFIRDGWDAWDAWLPTNDTKDSSQFIILPN